MSTTNYPTYSNVRDQKIKAITNQYYTMLNDYIQSYNSYLNGQNGVTESVLKDKNNQLLSIAAQLQKNNEQVKNDAATIFKNYQLDSSLYTSSSDIKQIGSDLNTRQLEIASSQQLASQMQQLTRYQNKVFWIRLTLMLLLLVGIIYVVRLLSTNQGDVWGFAALKKDASTVATTVSESATQAVKSAQESVGSVASSASPAKAVGGKLLKSLRK